jgi:hypothetical protein
MELAQFAYMARHFLVNVVNTLIHNFELSTDVFKIFHFPMGPGIPVSPLFPFRPFSPRGPAGPAGPAGPGGP